MKPYPVIAQDQSFKGHKVPREFVNFVRGIMNAREMDAMLLDQMIGSIPKEQYSVVQAYLNSLTGSDFSDADIVKIFWGAGARIIDIGRPQREVIAEFLDVISARMQGRVSTIPAYADIRPRIA